MQKNMKTISGSQLPNQNDNNYSLILIDVYTGIVLTIQGKRKRSSNEHWVFLFDSLEEAELFAKQKSQENQAIQCAIFDGVGKFVNIIPQDKIIKIQTPKDVQQNLFVKKKSWWKIW